MASLSVTITADVVDLQTKFAVARAELASFSRDLNSAARSVASSGLTDALKTQMDEAATGMLAARTRVDELGGSLEKVGVHVAGIREIHSAITELARGNLLALPSTFALLGESIGQFGLAGIGAIAGVTALSAGLAKLFIDAKQAADEADAVKDAFDMQRLAISAEEARKLSDALGAQAKELTHIRDATGDLRAGIQPMAETLAREFGTTVPDAVKILIATFSDLEKKGPELLTQMNAPKAAIDGFNEAVSHGEKAREYAIIIDEIASAQTRAAPKAQTYWQLFQEGIENEAVGAVQANADWTALDAAINKAHDDAIRAASVHPTNTPNVQPQQAAVSATEELKQQLAGFNVAWDQAHAYELKYWENVLADTKKGGADAVAVAQQQEQAYEAIYNLRTEAAREAAQKYTEAQRQAAAQAKAIADEVASHSVAMAKLELDGTKANLDDELAANQVNATRRIQLLEQATDKEYSIELGALQKKLALLDTESVDYEKTRHQIETIEAQHNITMEQLAKLRADAQKKTDTESANAFKTTFVDPSMRAFDQMVSGILQGTQTWQQTIRRVGANLVISEIENDAKWLANKAATNLLGLASDKTTSQAGVLAWVLGEQQKTAATVAGNATRDAADASSHQSFLGAIFDMIAGWLGFETEKTTATVTGDAAAAASSHLAGLAYAGEAAAGAMASVSAIPFVGWAMAPGVGAETFATAAGFASAEGGMWEVPGTMLALLHTQESVVPATVAGPMRNFFESSSGPSGQSSSTPAPQIVYNVQTLDASSFQAYLAKPSNLRQLARLMSTYITNNPSSRPGY